MNRRRTAWSGVVLGAVSLGFLAGGNRAQTSPGKAEVDAFNQQYIAAHLRMDNTMVKSFWLADGVSLLPETEPLVGKQAIGKFFDDTVAQIAGYQMVTMEIDFREIQVMGDWAYEWGLEHQVLQPPDGRPAIEGRGKILLILHKNGKGEWKIKQEMWNAAPKG